MYSYQTYHMIHLDQDMVHHSLKDIFLSERFDRYADSTGPLGESGEKASAAHVFKECVTSSVE